MRALEFSKTMCHLESPQFYASRIKAKGTSCLPPHSEGPGNKTGRVPSFLHLVTG